MRSTPQKRNKPNLQTLIRAGSKKPHRRDRIEPTLKWLIILTLLFTGLASLSGFWDFIILTKRGHALALNPSTLVKIAHNIPAGLAVFLVAFAMLFLTGLIPRPQDKPILWILFAPLTFFSTLALYVGLLVGLRLLFHLWILGRPYAFLSDPWTNMEMELLRGTIIGLILIAFCEIFHTWRVAHDYRLSRLIHIKSGQTTLEINGDDVLFVKGAANYAELHTRQGVEIVRMTLQELSDRFAEKNITLPRVHRSYLIAPNAVLSLEPTRAGDCKMLLWDGTIITGSRRYKAGIRKIQRIFNHRKPL